MSGYVSDVATVVEVEPKVSGFAGWFTTRPLWYLLVAAIIVNALLFGIGPVPYFRYAVYVMDDPFNIGSLPEIDELNVEPGSPLAWIITDLFGIDSYNGHVVAHLVLLIGCLTASTYLIARWVSDWAGRLFVAAWFASPLANVNLTWLGKPDHFTILAAVLLAVGPPGACAAGGLLLGFNHFEQGALIVVGTFLIRWFVAGDRSWRWVAHMAVGFVAGRAVWMVYANAVDYDASRRLDWVARDLESFVRVWRGDIPTLIFGAFGVVWVAVIVMWQHIDRPARLAAGVAFGMATIATCLTLDTTRVYSLVTLPILLGCVIWHSVNTERAVMLRVLPWFLLAAVFVPRVMLWGAGLPFVSSWERLG